ncbi:MAG TPA: hypothetical protein VEB22_11760 [Phycisphaerales bacterium]|nr:hypothetical protein [Phycisphaerales bacterium]
MAIISYTLNYIGVPFFAVPLIVRDNRFSLYHAKQCLILWLTAIALGLAWKVVTVPLALLTCGFGLIVAIPVLWAIIIGLWIINTVGLVHAVNGRCRPHPMVGTRAERWFSGIKVITPSTGAPH